MWWLENTQNYWLIISIINYLWQILANTESRTLVILLFTGGVLNTGRGWRLGDSIANILSRSSNCSDEKSRVLSIESVESLRWYCGPSNAKGLTAPGIISTPECMYEQRGPKLQKPSAWNALHSWVLYLRCRPRNGFNSFKPCANRHWRLWGQVPLSCQWRHNSVLYRLSW